MKRVLFVCLGNICRSPMAEGILNYKVKEKKLTFTCDSAGTSATHSGEKPDRRMRESANLRGYDLESIRSRQFVSSDFDTFDYILAMDNSNLRDILGMATSDTDREKVFLMTSFCKNLKVFEVPDPYYGGEDGFLKVIEILEDSIEGFISENK